jgi:hypothetical protein
MGAVTLAALSISPEPLDNDAFSTFMNTYFHPGREVSVALVDTFAIHSTDERVVEFAYVFGILPVKTYSMVDTDGNFSAEYDDLSNAVSHSVLSWEKWSFSPQNKTVTIHGVSYTVSIPEPEMLSEAGFMVACVPPGTPHGTTMHPDATRAMYVPMQVPVKADDSNLVGYDGTFFYPGGNGNARLLGYIMKKPPEHAQNAECPEPMILYNQGYRSSVLRVFRRR